MSALSRRRGGSSCSTDGRGAAEAAVGCGGGSGASGETALSPAPPPPAAPADAAWQEARETACFDAWLQLFPLLTHGATQATTLLGWRGMPAAEIVQRILSTLLVGLFWVLPTFCTVHYMRHRTAYLLSSRISFFAWPLLRKPRGIQHVLESAATTGVRGALRDIFKIVWGGRLVAVVLLSSITPLSMLPLTAHLLLQLYAVLMVRGNSSICTAPLLRDPLTRERIGRFHSVMGLLAYALPGGIGLALRARFSDNRDPTVECEAFLTCLSVVVALLLPAYVAVKTEPATSLQRRQAAHAQLDRAASEGAASSASTTDTAMDASNASLVSSVSCISWQLAQLASWLARMDATISYGIRHVFCGDSWLAGRQAPGAAGPGRPVRQLFWYERLAAWWLLLALVYEFALFTAPTN